MSKFKFIKLNEDVLPKTKGKKIDGFRFYEIDGKNYPSITTVLGIQKKKRFLLLKMKTRQKELQRDIIKEMLN